MSPLGQSGRLLSLQEVHCTTPAAATAAAMNFAILQVGNGKLLCNWLASPCDASFRQAHARRCRLTNPLANQQRRRDGRRDVDSSSLDGLVHACSVSRDSSPICPDRPTPVNASPQSAVPAAGQGHRGMRRSFVGGAALVGDAHRARGDTD